MKHILSVIFSLICITLVHFSFPSKALDTTCYNPDGSTAAGFRCENSTAESFCCEHGRTCLSNKLCGPSATDPNFGRYACTDKAWNSPECPQFCLPSTYSVENRLSNLLPCFDCTVVM